MKKIVLVVGNSVDPHDNLPLRLMKKIKKSLPDYQFIVWDPTEEFPPEVTNDLVLIDTVYGIKAIKIFEDLDDFQLSPRTTVHDFDLPVALALVKKIGKIKKIRIIGIPKDIGIKTQETLSAILQSI